MQIQDSEENHDARRVLRSSLDQLHTIEPNRARELEALAFILMRVAEADCKVHEKETLCMEQILIDHSDIPADQAMLVTEIARHRLAMADSGRAYEISRGLRHTLDAPSQSRVLVFLEKIARADGEICKNEDETISQIAWELGFNPYPQSKIDA